MKNIQTIGAVEEVGNVRDLDFTAVLEISVTKRRYGKSMTIIEGFNSDNLDLKELAKTLKRKIATGGTCKDGRIELQGDQRDRVKKILEDLGFEVKLK